MDGDGTLELVTGSQVFEGDGTVKVSTGVGETSLFPFDEDWKPTWVAVADIDPGGLPEIVSVHNQDQDTLQVLSPDNSVLWETCNTSATLSEYPVVADADGDGVADIITAANAYAVQCMDGSRHAGVRVFSPVAPGWSRTRSAWNQHSYHVTNIDPDGAVPVGEVAHFASPATNGFRSNLAIGHAAPNAAPNAVVHLERDCAAAAFTLEAIVRNLGGAPLPAGLPVGFYQGPVSAAVHLGSAVTGRTLGPGEAERVAIVIDSPDPGLLDGTTPAHARVEDPGPRAWAQCTLEDDTSSEVSVHCQE